MAQGKKGDFPTTQTGVRLPNPMLEKMKYIIWYERTTFTDKIIGMTEAEISRFEKENGPITVDQIEKSVKK